MLRDDERPHAELGQRIVFAGLVIYVIFAPHSVAASASGAVIATLGWLLRTLQTRSFGLRWSKFDLIIVLSLLWTVFSAFAILYGIAVAAQLEAVRAGVPEAQDHSKDESANAQPLTRREVPA